MQARNARIVDYKKGKEIYKLIVSYYEPKNVTAVLEVGKEAQYLPKGETTGRRCRINRFIPATEKTPLMAEVQMLGVPLSTEEVHILDLFSV